MDQTENQERPFTDSLHSLLMLLEKNKQNPQNTSLSPSIICLLRSKEGPYNLSRMITSISWVPKGAAKPVPDKAHPPSKEEIELLKTRLLDKLENDGTEEDDETMDVENREEDDNDDLSAGAKGEALAAADALGKAPKGSRHEADVLEEGLKELNMDDYDDEDGGVESVVSNNSFYRSNKEDPYLKDQQDEDSEEEENSIMPDDLLLVCARIVDDFSRVEVCILDDPSDKSSCYVRQEYTTPISLCTTWVGCPLRADNTGNFIAVGSMDPAIELWDLDTIDAMVPTVVLGGIIEKKRKGNKKYVKYKDGSHTGPVLALSWNKVYGNVLASASADKLVKIWDIATGTCKMTMEHHTDKVQAVAWNPFAPEVLLSGSFDDSVVMRDGRLSSHSGFRWSVAADVESVAWDPHTEHSFVVSLENGTVSGFDIRNASSNASSQSKPTFTIHAHDKAVTSVSYHSTVPNLLATGSMDKMVKLWDLTSEPSCVASKNPKAGAIFSISFSEDDPFTLAIGGSKGTLQIWDLLSDDGLSGRYAKYANKAKPAAP